MARLNLHAGSSAAVLASFALLLAAAQGCGKHSEDTDGASSADDDDSTGAHKADAGKGTTTPGKTSSKKDGGAGTVASGTGTTATTPDPMGPAPKTLLQLDKCGADNAAGLKVADIDILKAGGDTTVSLLYPYDQTVFPRGLSAPVMMWQGAAGQSVYLKIRSKYFEYDGCLKASAEGQLQLPQDVWEQAGLQTMGPSTPFAIELSLLDGSKVHGPAKQQIVIAQATLKGSIYYNSYNSATGVLGGSGDMGGGGGFLGGLGLGATGGSVLRIKPGKPAEFFARSGSCTGCHAVSANGERMVAKDLGLGGGLPIPGGGGGADGQVYTLATDTPANATPSRAAVNGAFVGLSPEGSVYINTAVQAGIGPNTTGAAGNIGNIAAAMYETDTGKVVASAAVPTGAMMPTFAADGSLLVFSDYADAQGKSLSLMDYDAKGRVLSNQRKLYTSGTGLTGWPFLLPDNNAVVFATTESRSYSGEGVGIMGPLGRGPRSDLYIVDVDSGKATILARAMGFLTAADADSDKTYLPFGAEELHQHYYPTVSPVAAGGYFWVFFDSVRHYGNQGLRRQLWAAAVAVQHKKGEFDGVDGLYAVDPSAPAFYVPGQEIDSANHRAFTALDPCRAEGATCETGVDCCSGFCTDGVCGPPKGCANDSERCELDTDCCNPTDKCVGGYCGPIFL